MPTNEPLNTLPIQQFISSVKSADARNAKDVKLDINTAKRLAFTLGEVMSRLEGDLEKILGSNTQSDENIIVQLGSNDADWK